MLKKQTMFPLVYVLIAAMVLVGCVAQPAPSAAGQQADGQEAMEALNLRRAPEVGNLR